MLLLQHQSVQIALQYRILHRIKHNIDVACVYGSGKMMIDPAGAAATAHTHKHLQHKVLDIQKRMRIAIKLWIVPAYISLWIAYFLLKQISFV